ncbi:MAG TPA: UDP-N-acetylmuramate dehydrogenase [Intrasporangiaceae bacterium]|nr:UDP-N-acetylmuramate dehydrogenase [Intrasporangiaceae bacterium]
MAAPEGPDVTADTPLAPLTTLRVGGPAARLVTVETTDDLVDAVREVDEADEPLLVLGGGSNLVISDDGFPGTVVLVRTDGVHVESADSCGGASVRIEAGAVWDDIVARSIDEGWAGIEALSGIPGSTGATPIQNVGAYGQEVAQTIAQVRVWDRVDAQVRTFANIDCHFTYRHSVFKGTRLSDGGPRYIVLEVVYQLELADLSRPIGYADLARQLDVAVGDRVPLADAREAVLAQRRARGMVLDEFDRDTWSCGSFFTNPILTVGEFEELTRRVHTVLGEGVDPPRFADPHGNVKTSAAWLIDRAGFGKGYAVLDSANPPASLSTKHTLAVTNRGTASAADIVELARHVRDGVEERFGVRLVNEPVLVGVEL